MRTFLKCPNFGMGHKVSNIYNGALKGHDSYRLICLKTCPPPISRTVWEGLGCIALLEEVCHGIVQGWENFEALKVSAITSDI